MFLFFLLDCFLTLLTRVILHKNINTKTISDQRLAKRCDFLYICGLNKSKNLNMIKTKTVVLILFLALMACNKQQTARRPISQESGSFMKASIKRNKKLVATEEDKIKAIIKQNPTTKYIASSKGYWYYYETQNLLDSLVPQKGDIATFEYDVKNLAGGTIYAKEELGLQTYLVDKQDILMGLRDGIKLMHKKETVTFIFPSHIAYGYHGDANKIGTNQPIICTVTLHDFKPELRLKKAMSKTILNPETITKSKDSL